RETVETLLRTIGAHTWTAIYGGPNTGKSQLVLLVAMRMGQCRGWVRFNHSMRLDAACDLLDAALVHLAGVDRIAPGTDVFGTACRRLGAGSLLVLDDLPRMAGDEPFSQRLTLLARASREEGCNILSTSQRMLPLRVQSEAGEEVILERPVP